MALGDLGSAFINLRLNAASLVGDIQSFGMGAIAAQIDKIGDKITDMGKQSVKEGLLPIGVAVAANLVSWQSLEKQIQETVTLFGSGGVTQAATQQFDDMREVVAALSAEMGVMESEVAPALYQAISAGVPRENVFSFLETAQKVAIGGATDVTTAVDLLTTATNSFASQNLTAQDAADTLFRGVARGKTTIEELSSSMARVSPVVAAAGIDFAEFVAVIATMTLSGTATAEAMTNVRAALTGLTKPTEELNEIWRKAGFTTSDAAIGALGLQGAMQLVTDATGGSISQITQLVGGMEATNAILQVTGDNADRFNSVLADTATAAGSAEQAFGLMQETTGRAFGAFTASLDRLGNAGGDLSDDFVVPIVQGLTEAIGAVAGFVKDFTEFVKPLAELWKGFITAVLDNEAFRLLSKSLLAAFVGFNSLKIVIGVVLIALGGFIHLFTTFLTGGLLRLAIGSYGKQLLGLATLFDKIGIKLGRIAFIGGTVEGGLGKAAGAARKLGTALSPARLLGWGAGIAIVAAAAVYAKNKFDEWSDTIRITSVGADRLADKLGLITRDIASIPTTDLTFSISFSEENEDMLDELRSLISAGAGQDALLQIGLRFVQLGNTPEEAYDALERLIALAGLPIRLQFEADELGGGAQSLIDSIKRNLPDLSLSELGARSPVALIEQSLRSSTEVERLKSAATLLGADVQLAFVEGYNSGDYGDLFDIVEFLREVESQFGPRSAVSQIIARGIASSVDGLDVSLFSSNPIDDLIGQMVDESAGSTNAWGLGSRIVEGLVDEMGEPIDLPKFRPPPTEEAIAAYQEILDAYEEFPVRVDEIFADAEAFVADRFDGINQQFLDAIPIVGEYTGAVELKFKDWLASQRELQDDFQLWADRSADILGGLPDEVASRIEGLSISEKTWLASLGDDELATAIATLTETFSLASAAAEAEFDALGSVISTERTDLIATEMAALVDEMGEKGIDTAEAWVQLFTTTAEAQWGPGLEAQVSAAMARANSYIARNPLIPPSWDVGPAPNFSPTSGTGTSSSVTVNQYGNTTSTAGEINRAANTVRVLVGGS